MGTLENLSNKKIEYFKETHLAVKLVFRVLIMVLLVESLIRFDRFWAIQNTNQLTQIIIRGPIQKDGILGIGFY